MARRLLPPFERLWQRHETLYQEVFASALERLAAKDSLSGDEDALSEMLCPILSSVCSEIYKSRNVDISTPYWEPPIQPVSDDELKGGKKRNRPDFTCKLRNPWFNSPGEFEIPLHIECKRVGKPTSPTWILNKNYVTNGIARFDSITHEYGKRAPSGIMIGYVISMEPEAISTEVNQYQKSHLPDNPSLDFSFEGSSVSQTKQSLQRKHVSPYEFGLFHLWVDLRGKYTQ